MRVYTAGGTAGGRIAVVGLFAALAGGLLWAPAGAASEPAAEAGDTGATRSDTPAEVPAGIPAEVPRQGEPGVGTPVTGSSWTLRRAADDGVVVTVSTTSSGVPEKKPETVSGTVDTGLANGSSWT